jgi:hypothetical protein
VDVNGNCPPFDSYVEWDFERWGVCQSELSSSVMMDMDCEAGLAKLYPLPVIADVEASDDVLYQASLT